MIINLAERTQVSIFEPIPWEAHISEADMATIILSRLPSHPTRNSIRQAFGNMPESKDTLYWDVNLPTHWWSFLNSGPYWHILFHIDPESGVLERLEVKKLASK